jgi:hypothetical protein
MKSLVRDGMTTEAVTVEPWTPFRDIVTRLAQHRISCLNRTRSRSRRLCTDRWNPWCAPMPAS